MRLSQEKKNKIIEQILLYLYHSFPNQPFTAEIAREIARDEEFIKRILFELKEINNFYFDINRLKIHQLKTLLKINKLGGESFLVFKLSLLNKIVILKSFDYFKYQIKLRNKKLFLKDILKIGYIIEKNTVFLINYFS